MPEPEIQGSDLPELGDDSHFAATEGERIESAHRKNASDPDSQCHREPTTIPARHEHTKKDKKSGDTLAARAAETEVFGTCDPNLAGALLDQLILVTPEYDPIRSRNLLGALSTVRGMAPRDDFERLLIVEMVGVHNAAVRQLGLASQNGQPPEMIDANLHRAVRLSRTFVSLLDALNRHRGKGGQPMVVESVNVNDGGQAIVGPVSHTGREEPSEKMTGKMR